MTDPETKPDAGAAPAAETAAPASEPPAASDAERIAGLETEVADLKDQILRALADTENFRRRAQREREETAKFAVSNFAKDLVAVADNLRRALESVPDSVRQGNEALAGLLVGVEATERQLAAAFERVGIRKLEPLGEVFDPNFHQVVFEAENTGKPAGTVVQLLQAGYVIHGRLLREAMVGVAKGPTAESAAARLDTHA